MLNHLTPTCFLETPRRPLYEVERLGGRYKVHVILSCLFNTAIMPCSRAAIIPATCLMLHAEMVALQSSTSFQNNRIQAPNTTSGRDAAMTIHVESINIAKTCKDQIPCHAKENINSNLARRFPPSD